MTGGPPSPARPCPICRRPSEPRWRPFCSRRCADVDLGRWLGEVYRIPVAPSDDEEPERDDGAGGDGDPDDGPRR